jgi:hypothetical protein
MDMYRGESLMYKKAEEASTIKATGKFYEI